MDIPPRIYSPGHPPRTISLPTQDISPAVKANICKLALTHTLDPNRPTTRVPGRNRHTTWGPNPNSNPNPNRPTWRRII